MSKLVRFRLVCFSVFVVGAMAVGSAVHLPAMAAERLDQYVAPLVSSTCSSSSACLSEQNNGAGPGVTAISAKGNGAIGQTKFKSTSPSSSKAGVVGQDLSTASTFNQGVLGASNFGTGVEGTSANGYGVQALSSSQSALFSKSTLADGVQSISLNNDGTNSSTQNNSTTAGVGRSGVWGHDDSTDGGHLNVGVAGSSTNGTGISASSSGWVGLSVTGGLFDKPNFLLMPALAITAGSGGPATLIDACTNVVENPCNGFSSSVVFELGITGDLKIAGHLFTAGSCHIGCAKTRSGILHKVLSYGETQTLPSIDDFGEAQLVHGRASVHLSADFANVIDQQANYLVFITPEGDSHGLYVTQKTASSFEVRENGGGTSSLAFSYRVVAKPLGASGTRLPMATIGSATQRL